jgi:hypothetical protein
VYLFSICNSPIVSTQKAARKDAGLWLQSTCFPRSYEQQAQKVRADHAQRNNPARQASRGERPIEQHHSAYGHAITVTADDVFFNFSSPRSRIFKVLQFR